MPKLEQFEIKKYWQIFSGLKPVDQKVTHDQVLPILYNSKQDSSVLNKIWFLADIDDDDNLDFEEFVICMRLIFDMVNKNIDKVPEELPDWLIPGSKGKLVKERKQRKAQENESMPPQKEPPKMDWYISAEDMNSYNKLLDSTSKSNDGTVSYSSLSLAIKNKFFNIGSSDIEKVWKLVNPRGFNSIDKDPALYFIHLLRQRNDVGSLIPTEAPKNLESVFEKQPLQYDLKSEQAQVKRTTTVAASPVPAKIEPTNSGIVKSTPVERTPVHNTNTHSNNHIITTAEVNIDAANLNVEKARLIREQLQGLLQYKNDKYKNGKPFDASKYNLKSFTNDLTDIEQQVDDLTTYLNQKKEELNSLNNEISNNA